MNKSENIEKGEFFNFKATITRRNGKFYIVTWQGVHGVQGSGSRNTLEDNTENLFKIKDTILSSLKSCFEIYFERSIFEEKTKEQLKKITKENCYKEYLLTDRDSAEAYIIREKADMEEMLSKAELIRMELG